MENKNEMTGWYPPEMHPARVGWYARDRGNGNIGLDRWNGTRWIMGGANGEEYPHFPPGQYPWCGITAPWEA